MNLDASHPFPPDVAGQITLPDQLTPFTDKDLATAITVAYREVFNDELSRRPLCCLVAQCALETGRGKFTHRWNIGNVKAAETYRGSVTFFSCNEVIDGKLKWFDPYHPQCRFRAFGSLDAGSEQHLRFLGTATRGPGKPNRYAAAWDAAMVGDPTGFCDELSRAGYFTADLSTYRGAVVRLFRQLMTDLPSMLHDQVHTHEPVVRQVTNGHSPITNEDLQERIEHLQLPLEVDWDELRAARDAAVRENS